MFLVVVVVDVGDVGDVGVDAVLHHDRLLHGRPPAAIAAALLVLDVAVGVAAVAAVVVDHVVGDLHPVDPGHQLVVARGRAGRLSLADSNYIGSLVEVVRVIRVINYGT